MNEFLTSSIISIVAPDYAETHHRFVDVWFAHPEVVQRMSQDTILYLNFLHNDQILTLLCRN